MRISKEEDHRYRQLSLPAVFVRDYLPQLSGEALKLYLILLLASEEGDSSQLEAERLAPRLACTADQVPAFLAELEKLHLLQKTGADEAYCLLDLQRRQASLPRPSAEVEQSFLQAHREEDDFRQFIEDLNLQFFSGVMGHKWLVTITRYYQDYGFSLEVIHQLLSYAGRHNRLRAAYTDAIAKDWYERNIRTMADLEVFWGEQERCAQLCRYVAKQLRISLNQYQEEKIAYWYRVLGYEEDVLDFAFKQGLKLQRPSFEIYDRWLQAWHDAGLRNLAQIQAYEEAEKARRQAERQQVQAERRADRQQGHRQSSAAKGRAANFEQRAYEADFYEQFYAHQPLEGRPEPSGYEEN